MILYFTATGNSRWIAELLAEAMHDTAVSIVDCLKQGSIPAGLSTADRLGIVFPVHSWYAPRVLIDFLSQLRLPDCCYRYAVCTCGDDMGKGMNRLAEHFPLDAAWSVAMPNTYVPMFDLDDEALCRKKIENARHAIASIAAGLVLGLVSYRSRSIALGFLLHGSVALSMDTLVLWHKGYFTAGLF